MGYKTNVISLVALMNISISSNLVVHDRPGRTAVGHDGGRADGGPAHDDRRQHAPLEQNRGAERDRNQGETPL